MKKNKARLLGASIAGIAVLGAVGGLAAAGELSPSQTPAKSESAKSKSESVSTNSAKSDVSVAASYWKFKSKKAGTCLTGGKKGSAFLSKCSGSSRYQQWHWVKSSKPYKSLKNRATGGCLETKNSKVKRPVWAGKCNGTTGEKWAWKKGKLGSPLANHELYVVAHKRGSASVYGKQAPIGSSEGKWVKP